MAELVLYSDSLSQPSRAVEIFLLVNKISYRNEFIDLLKGKQKSKMFSDINPLKKVPVISDNGFVIKESIAILRYLCHEKNCADHWYPKDSKRRAQIDEYLSWHHSETRAKCYSYVRYKSVDPLVKGIEPCVRVLKKMESDVNDVLNVINDIWLKDSSFIKSELITIADIIAATELEQLSITGFDPTIRRPALSLWLRAVKQFTSPYYDQVHGRLNTLVQQLA